ncbi:ABC transporter substrate-binding protein [Roseateles microcysteis]|uniref:ABC transporter substrate-binding protein n=1 Tax=Roseateles microcysteis TaxID=3119057 RepID=UPI002FE56946
MLKALLLLMLSFALTTAGAEEYYERYDLRPQPGVIRLAVQPMAYPLAFISSVMQRDRILGGELDKAQLKLQVFAFRKGNDIVQVASESAFDMAFVGDMPTVNLAVRMPIAIGGLGKRNFSSVISRDYARLEELRGHKLGYSPGSSSHLVLMHGLRSAKLSERDVELVALDPAQMPDALESGAVDAFSAWEPTPSIALARNPRNRAIFKGMSTDWVVLRRSLTTSSPAVAQSLIAAYVRAINWMRRSKSNLEHAASWVLQDGQAFTGAKSAITAERAMEIARKDLLDVPGAPATPPLVDGAPPLSREFAFLKDIGRIASDRDDKPLREAFAYQGLTQVQADPKRFSLFRFDYAR